MPQDGFTAGYLPGITKLKLNRDTHQEGEATVVNTSNDPTMRSCKVITEYYNSFEQVTENQIVTAEGVTSTTSVTSSSSSVSSSSSSTSSSTSSSSTSSSSSSSSSSTTSSTTTTSSSSSH